MDSRLRFPLTIGEYRALLLMKYQSPSIDVALAGEDLVVRMSEFTQDVFTEGKFEGVLPLAPFAFRAPARLLLCFASPKYHCSSYSEAQEFDLEPEDREPSVAKADGTAQPQPLVCFGLKPSVPRVRRVSVLSASQSWG